MSNYVNRTGKTYGQIVVRSRGLDYISPKGEKRSQWWCECLVCGAGFFTDSNYLGRDRCWKEGCRICSYKHRTALLRKEKGHSGFVLMFLQYKNNAKKMGREFTLTESEFKSLSQDNCIYCGSTPSQEVKPPRNNGRTLAGVEWATYISNGIDRVDNAKGYIYGNCVTCCGKCNLMKRSWEVGEFMSHIKKIYLHNN